MKTKKDRDHDRKKTQSDGLARLRSDVDWLMGEMSKLEIVIQTACDALAELWPCTGDKPVTDVDSGKGCCVGGSGMDKAKGKFRLAENGEALGMDVKEMTLLSSLGCFGGEVGDGATIMLSGKLPMDTESKLVYCLYRKGLGKSWTSRNKHRGLWTWQLLLPTDVVAESKSQRPLAQAISDLACAVSDHGKTLKAGTKEKMQLGVSVKVLRKLLKDTDSPDSSGSRRMRSGR